jgi:hypothetical protein
LVPHNLLDFLPTQEYHKFINGFIPESRLIIKDMKKGFLIRGPFWRFLSKTLPKNNSFQE